MGPGALYYNIFVCVCSVWVPCVALPSGGGSSVGPSPLCWSPCVGPLCGSPVRVPCVGPLCVGPLCGSPVWVPRCAASCCIYSRDASRSFTRSRICIHMVPLATGLMASQSVVGQDPDRTHVHVHLLAQSRSTGTAEDGQGPPAARHAALSGAPHASALAALDGITHTASELHTRLGQQANCGPPTTTTPTSSRALPTPAPSAPPSATR